MSQLISSKNLLLSPRPLTVGAVSQPESLARLFALPMDQRLQQCDIVELRLDLLELDTDELRDALPQLGIPVLLTARHPAEGGQGDLDAASRAAMIEPLLDLAALVDIELRSVREMQSVISKARQFGVAVLGSFHDFTGTPGDEVLAGAVAAGTSAGLDAVKFATFLNSPDDLIRLMRLAAQKHRLPLSVMGMGSLGRVSRIALAKLGSVLNYGFIGESNAPGQWPAARLKELLAEV